MTSQTCISLSTACIYIKYLISPYIIGNGTLTEDLPLAQQINSLSVAEANSLEAHSASCIRSLVDLRQAYLDFKTAPGSMPKDSTIFSFYPTKAVKFTSLAIFYDISAKDNGNSSSPKSSGYPCCNPNNTSTCKVFLRHHSYLYKAAYAALIFLYAFPEAPYHVGKSKMFERAIHSKFGVQELCWKVPPICDSSKTFGMRNDKDLLEAFTAEVCQHVHIQMCT